MKNETKHKILQWIWKWSCKLLNYHPPIIPIETYKTFTTKIQLAQFCFMISKRELSHWDDTRIKNRLAEEMTRGLRNMFSGNVKSEVPEDNDLLTDFCAITMDEEIKANGDKLVRAQLRYLPWKEQK